MTSRDFPSSRPQRRRSPALAFATFALVAAALPMRTAAQVLTNHWLSDVAVLGTGNWSDGLYWSILPTVPRLQSPQTGENVVIAGGLLNTAPVVTLNADASIGQLTLGSGATLAIDNGRSFTFANGSTINGTLRLNSTGTNTDLNVNGTLTLAGTGTLVMSADSHNRVRGSSSDSLVNQITIRGGGALGANALTIVNQGSVVADTGVPLVIDPGSGGVTNTGTLRATGGGTLQLKNGAFNNQGGVIEAQNGSTVSLDGGDVTGGTLTTSGTGRIDIAGSTTVQDVTISSGSLLSVLNGVTARFLGTVLNEGTLALLGTSSDTDLKISGTVTLDGTGAVMLIDSDKNRIYADGSGTLILGANQTLSGAGKLGRNNLVVSNLGTITAVGTNALELDNDGSSFTNQGTLKAQGAGGLVLRDASVTNQGMVEVASALSANGTYAQTGSGSITRLLGGSITASSFAFNGGTLGGSGSITGPVTASGTTSVFPGGAGTVGTLTFNQTFSLGASTSLHFDIGGSTAGTGHDRVNGTTINLDGTLFLAFANAFESSVTNAQTFTLVSASTALNGTFAGLPNGSRLWTTDGLGSFQVNYLANSLTLTDFQAVPEPSTYAMLGLGAATFLLVQRRRRRQER